MIHPVDILATAAFLRDKRPDVYLEWGTGCSAGWFSVFANHVLAIDTDEDWLKYVGAFRISQCLGSRGRFHAHRPILSRPDGSRIPLGQYGIPTREEDYLFAGGAYVNFLDTFQFGEDNKIDIVLIDGRYRVACALKLLNFHTQFAKTINYTSFWIIILNN